MAKKDKSALISGMGVAMSIITSLVEKGKRAGLSDEDFHHLATPEGEYLLDQMVEMMRRNTQPESGTYRVTVDYSMSLEDMIAAGEYNLMSSNITAKNFPINKQESGEIEVHIAHFGQQMTIKRILAKLNEQGLRPATLPELCALGESYPELQRRFTIVALGSEWHASNDNTYVPCLCERGGERSIHLDVIYSDSWRLGSDRFLAVSK